MNTLAPNAKIISKPGEFLLLEANLEHTNTYIPKLLTWDNILSNTTKWNLENIQDVIKEDKIPLPGQLIFFLSR